MIQERYFEDYTIDEAIRSTGRTITEADIMTHAGQTGDYYPHHVDAEWCATQPFKYRIAHGTLIFSVGVGMVANVINPRSMSYGYEKIRFVKPVFIGDTITAVATITEKRDQKGPRHGIIVEKLEVFKQDGSVAVVADHLHLVERRP